MNRRPTEQAGMPAARVVEIELLALDLTTCTRCVGTLENIEKAVGLVRPVLEATGASVNLTRRVITSEDQARQHRFVSSPTVRIDGRDIVFENLESKCDSCTDLCGCDDGTSCRVWPYQGQEFTEAPVGLVVESLLRAFSGESEAAGIAAGSGDVPENLRRFFEGRKAAAACCTPAEQETCCVPNEKSGCCDSAAPVACGCR